MLDIFGKINEQGLVTCPLIPLFTYEVDRSEFVWQLDQPSFYFKLIVACARWLIFPKDYLVVCVIGWNPLIFYWNLHDDIINGNIYRVTGPLCGEFTGHRWIPLTKASDAELWCFLWSCTWINAWVNNLETGYLRRHHAHCDIIVMISHCIPDYFMNDQISQTDPQVV